MTQRVVAQLITFLVILTVGRMMYLLTIEPKGFWVVIDAVIMVFFISFAAVMAWSFSTDYWD